MHARALIASLAVAASLVAADGLGDVMMPSNTTHTATRELDDSGLKTCMALLGSVVIPGNDIGVASGTFPPDCVPHCVAHEGCMWFTWTATDGGTCFLKSGDVDMLMVEVKEASGPVSGFVRRLHLCPPVGFGFRDTDLVAGDIGDAPGADLSECYWHCVSTSGCTQYTWSNALKGPTCWLKSVNEGMRYTVGVNSVKMARSYPFIINA